jgi:trehalose 6-phosphate synthase/phosphatase
MSRLLIVSNRLPISVLRSKGKLSFKQSVGGLATGLQAFYKSYNSVWIGWPGISPDNPREKQEIESRLTKESGYLPVFLSRGEIDRHYNGFCNKTIWPIFHYFPHLTAYNDSFWEAYKQVNKIFSEIVLRVAREDDIIWVHDYHLMLLPKLIRDTLPNVMIGFFLHTPFPSFEVFRNIPQRNQILEGILGADLIGFHTYDYVCHFLDSVRRILRYDYTLGQIINDNRVLKADAFPMGIEYERYASAASIPRVKREISAIRKKMGDRKIILSIDRLDYTKGILQRLEAFDLFLEKNHEFKEKVSLVLVAVPSRGEVERYALLKKELDELVGKINGKHGTIGWIPISYLHRVLPSETLLALYVIADVAMVTPLRDGMNLIAKEYVASKASGGGVLILSEMAGAAQELGEAIIVNPNDRTAVSMALRDALTLPEKEKTERNEMMRSRLRRYDIVRWARDFMDHLYSTKDLQKQFYTKRLTGEIRAKLIDDFSKADNRLILLDYDGTLVPFSEVPEKAVPDQALLKLLEQLSANSRNEIVVVSGRDRDILQNWFRDVNVGLVAEHGGWVKERGEEWNLIQPARNEWKKDVRPILELYVDRTPGSFVEEKTLSLAWHYRKADPELASVRASELRDSLSHLTADTELGVLEGKKVIEVRNLGIDKGTAASRWVLKRNWSFVLAMGDDNTDEDLFAVIPESAYTIRIGMNVSRAKFNISSQKDALSLLSELTGK